MKNNKYPAQATHQH